MPPKSKKTRAPRKRVPRSIHNSNNVRTGPNTAKVVETVANQAINLNTPYLFIKAGITGVRAQQHAQAYGLYRVARITFTYKPLFDTYSSSLAGTGNSPNSLPTLYWKMNRYGDMPAAFDGDDMRTLGAKPNRLDDRNIVVSYKPNILITNQDAAGVASSQVKMTPWLSTDQTPQDQAFAVSTAEHYGHTLFVEGGGAGTAQGPVCYMDVTIVYEFKNPRIVASQGSEVGSASYTVDKPSVLIRKL